jgi:hypothetical protein
MHQLFHVMPALIHCGGNALGLNAVEFGDGSAKAIG